MKNLIRRCWLIFSALLTLLIIGSISYRNRHTLLIKMGSAKAMTHVARQMLETPGISIEQRHKAILLLRRAVAKGNPDAMLLLGIRLIYTHPEEGIDLLSKSAERGTLQAYVMLGNHFRELGWKYYDIERSITYYETAAAKGSIDAIRALGFIYCNNRSPKYNLEKGIRCLKRALEIGHDPVAGIELSKRQSIPADTMESEAALKLYSESKREMINRAVAGDPICQWYFGRCYEQGIIVDKDRIEAYKWMSLAEKQGCFDAKLDMAALSETLSEEEMQESIRRATMWENRKI